MGVCDRQLCAEAREGASKKEGGYSVEERLAEAQGRSQEAAEPEVCRDRGRRATQRRHRHKCMTQARICVRVFRLGLHAAMIACVCRMCTCVYVCRMCARPLVVYVRMWVEAYHPCTQSVSSALVVCGHSCGTRL